MKAIPYATKEDRAAYESRRYQNKYKVIKKEKYDSLSLDQRLDTELKRKYGFSLEGYTELYSEQNGKCFICSTHKPSRGKDRLVVDHCHETGAVRGLLCHKCNRGIGFLCDDKYLLLNAFSYLEGADSPTRG